MTTSELAREVFALVEAKVLSRPSPLEFEMAYQNRLAMERIRFAIREMEKHVPGQSRLCEATLQLADALDRLQSADRHFQQVLRARSQTATHDSNNGHNGTHSSNGADAQLSPQTPAS